MSTETQRNFKKRMKEIEKSESTKEEYFSHVEGGYVKGNYLRKRFKQRVKWGSGFLTVIVLCLVVFGYFASEEKKKDIREIKSYLEGIESLDNQFKSEYDEGVGEYNKFASGGLKKEQLELDLRNRLYRMSYILQNGLIKSTRVRELDDYYKNKYDLYSYYIASINGLLSAVSSGDYSKIKSDSKVAEMQELNTKSLELIGDMFGKRGIKYEISGNKITYYVEEPK
ncbi:hypothetical protein GC093_20815 [Paenibacillus sp. LMG 31456]|uniref:Uncharacterized protein n=1 Tax=Paenibacillus foliorum TaxID=2654974 RepID=A0A972GRR2_9BACL|nr:hypothetical protein [Paenibacillus foliorum]NOU95651.1 hypothetical protein [Paenibacillus foliorum]